MYNEMCGDNRFEIIAKAKEDLLNSTNINRSEDEMKVLDSFLFRCWQMRWLKQYEVEDELIKAMKLLKREYERAKCNDFVRKPLAYALYQVWKKADAEAEGERE